MKNSSNQVVVNNHEVDFDAAVNLMDDEIREAVHSGISADDVTNQEFIDLYVSAHYEKFGEEFTVN